MGSNVLTAVVNVVILAGMLTSTGCWYSGVWVPPWNGQDDVNLTEHQKEIRRSLVDLAAYPVKGMDALPGHHAARARLHEIVTEDDVSLLAKIALAGDYRDIAKGPRVVGGWRPRIYVSNTEYKRLEAQDWMARGCMDILTEYYIKSNSPKVRDVFLGVLRDYDAKHVDYLRLALLSHDGVPARNNRLTALPIPGLHEKTDWFEAVHRNYLSFVKLESSIEAATYLFWSEKYRPEAVWFWCSVFKNKTLVCSPDYMKQIRLTGTYVFTPREHALVDAYQSFSTRAAYLSDRPMLVKYMLPWAKYLRATESKNVWFSSVSRDLDATHVPLRDDIDTRVIRNIKAGTPVPPKPDTVLDTPKPKRS
jgi:hypothetical protein